MDKENINLNVSIPELADPVTPRENGHSNNDTPPPSDEEPELQNLVSARSVSTNRPASAPGAKVTTPSVKIEGDSTTRKSTSSLKINIPQV